MVNLKQTISKLNDLSLKMMDLSSRLYDSGHIGEATEVTNSWYALNQILTELTLLDQRIDIQESQLRNPLPSDPIELIKENLAQNKERAERKIKTANGRYNKSLLVYNQLKDFKGDKKKEEKKKEEEKPKPKKEPEKKPKAAAPVKKEPTKKAPPVATTPAEKFNKITKEADQAVKKFNEKIPAAQRATYEELMLQLKRLDLNGGNIKATVANLKIIQSIKNRLTRIILNDEYLGDVKEFVASFNEVAKLQNEYWKSVESKFKPTALLREIRLAAISDTVTQLTDSGIGANISDVLTDILRQNITGGGSYKALQNQLLEALTDTNRSDGLLTRYSKQITNDSIQQYNRQYTQQVAAGLGMEWYAYQGSDIKGTRPFCDALTDIRYFHQSEVPRLLRAEDLYYMKDGKRTKVPIYARTGLPHGLIEGTNAENFFIRAGGYNCGHSIRPVPERNVPIEVRDRVYNTPAYHRWKATQ